MDKEIKFKKVRLIYIIGALLIFPTILVIINFVAMETIPIIFKIILYLTMGYGAYISWTAFRTNKKKAWLLICIFCLSIFFNLVVRTSIKAIFHERYEKNTKSYMVDKNGKKIETENININVPIFQILLVIGLYYLAKDERKKIKREQNISNIEVKL
jgi:hypothetical protein